MAGDDAGIGGARHGTLEGVEAGVDDVGRAPVGGPEAPCQGGAACALGGFEGRPAAQDVATDRRLLLGKPLQALWEVVFEGPGEAVRTPDFVTDQATAMGDELGEGTHGGALGLQGLELVPMFQEECDLEFRLGGGVFGSARGKRFAVPGHGERIDGKEHEESIVTQRRHDGPLREVQAHRDGLSVASCAAGLAPGMNLCRALGKTQKRTVRRARGLAADIVFRISPVEANKGRTGFGGWLLHG